jgi:tetratricopeptide (TPR) repeat protein
MFGNNYEISYKDFAELWKETNNAYAVVRPKNYKEILKKMTKKSKYQPRIPAMEQKNLLLNVVYAEELVSSTSSKEIFSSKELEKAIREIEKEEAAFQYFPPFWRVLEYGSLLYYYVNKGDLTKALSYAEKIEELNKDLDKKFDGWRYLWPYGKEFPEAWVRLGHLYLRVGNKEKAKDMFERAKNLQDRLSVEYRRDLQLGIDKLAK